ncbi:MAG: hypothetical protein A3F67_04010 [Verrucomicrobia bacterium RIFCSPHIGHO2_12_FULL_41_10]|nr:MAG: hypothetical protein A3F67_04010 [Verrucomicrobia bacterium RIFCSPHIGHO2_12_FULL_41_10]HLB34578.1 hypothetical protein [Chthoniobacterales bacterium]
MNKLLILLAILINSNFLLSKEQCIFNKSLIQEDCSANYNLLPKMEMFNPEEAQKAEEVIENFINNEISSTTGSNHLAAGKNVEPSTSFSLSPRESIFNDSQATNFIISESKRSKESLSVGCSILLTNAQVASRYKKRAAQAEGIGDGEIAALWIQAYEQMQLAIEYEQRSELLTAEGREEEAASLETAEHYARSIAFSLARVAQYLLNARKESIKNPEIAALWVRAVTQERMTVEYLRQAAQAYASGNKEEEKRLGRVEEGRTASCASDRSASELGKAAEYLIEARTAENPESAALFTRAAEQSQVASDYFSHAAQSIALGHEDEGRRWSSMGWSTMNGCRNLASAAQCLDTAQVDPSWIQSLLWKRKAQQYQVAAASRSQAAQAYASGNKEEGERYDLKGEGQKPTRQRLRPNRPERRCFIL